MPGITCSICLDDLKTPVVTPCGHVHCEECLQNYIASGPSAIQSTCPTCRAPFPTFVPDLRYVPDRLHPFIMAAVHRVYLDLDAANNTNELVRLEQIIAHLEEQNSILSGSLMLQTNINRQLIATCETSRASSRLNGERERSMRLENEKMKAVAGYLKRRYDDLKIKYNALNESRTMPEPGPSALVRSINWGPSQVFSSPVGVSDECYEGEHRHCEMRICDRPLPPVVTQDAVPVNEEEPDAMVRWIIHG